MAHSEAPGMRGGLSGPGQMKTRPGSAGERRLQQQLGTTTRAERFYDEQVLDHLNERMWEFTERQEMFFLATSDQHGECDNSFRAGPAGFLRVLDSRTLLFPEYRGNGVHASLGNIEENPHLGILMVDFVRARIGLHVNGSAQLVEDEEMRTRQPDLPVDPIPGRRAQLWVLVGVEEAYIHCAKHIPHLQKAPKRSTRDWGTDDYKRKGGDFFGAARDARDRGRPAEHPSPEQERVTSAPVTVDRAEAEPAEAEAVAAEHAVPEPVPYPGSNSTDTEPASGHQEDWATMALSTITPAARSAHRGVAAPDTESSTSQARQVARSDETSWSVPGPVSPTSEPVREAPPASAAPPAPTAPPASEAAGRHPDFDQEKWRQEAARALAEAERRARENAQQDPVPFQGWFS